MDMYVLYGETIASFGFHGALIFAAVTFLKSIALNTESRIPFFLIFILVIAFGSFLTNGLLLLTLHQYTCAGLKNIAGILKGAAVGSLITVIMALIPFFIEPLRLVISQIIMTHRYLAIPARVEAESVLKDAATQIEGLATAASTGTLAPEIRTPLTGEGVGSLKAEDYAIQTLDEAKWAASYLAAFAGAYGMALGAQWTSDCKA